MTTLADILRAEIRTTGPIGIDRFMAECLGNPDHGYYHTRDPLGAAGDFTTSPEISQVFGEIIGLFLAERWRAMGGPVEVQLVELGPGRGTLMADLLRALKILPDCHKAMSVHLVETSPVLRAAQRATLSDRHPALTPQWHDRLDSVPDGPMLLVANELFDALPIRQFQFDGAAWRETMIGLDAAGQFEFVPGAPASISLPPPPETGSIIEIGETGQHIARQIGDRLARYPGCAILIDYGHLISGFGDTLQAVQLHRPVPVLHRPGEVDLTAHVDFQALTAALTAGGAIVTAATTQARFLLENGVGLRDQALTRNKPDSEAASIRAGISRLIDPVGMGSLFKVLIAESPKETRC